MNSTILPLLTFSQQCEWLRAWIAERPDPARSEPYRVIAHAAAESCFVAGEVRLGVTIAWLCIVRRADPTARLVCSAQSALLNSVILDRPDLRAWCLGVDELSVDSSQLSDSTTIDRADNRQLTTDNSPADNSQAGQGGGVEP